MKVSQLSNKFCWFSKNIFKSLTIFENCMILVEIKDNIEWFDEIQIRALLITLLFIHQLTVNRIKLQNCVKVLFFKIPLHNLKKLQKKSCSRRNCYFFFVKLSSNVNKRAKNGQVEEGRKDSWSGWDEVSALQQVYQFCHVNIELSSCEENFFLYKTFTSRFPY